MIKPFIIGLKNWLFSTSSNGSNANAMIYSIIETAKANNLIVEEYLTYLFYIIIEIKIHYVYFLTLTILPSIL